MFNKAYAGAKKFLKENIKYIIFLLIVAFLLFFRLPYMVYSPGGLVNINDRISIDNEYDTKGSLNMTYVSARYGNIPSLLTALILPTWDIVSNDEILYDGETMDEMETKDKLLMEESISNAAIVAYHKADVPINIKSEKTTIEYVLNDYYVTLKPLDEIISIDGNSIGNKDDIKDAISNKEVGDRPDFVVLRDDKEEHATCEIFEIDGEKYCGIMLITNTEYETTNNLKISSKSSESGPSGGLMMSLEIYNKLISDDITKGYTISGTGTIEANGQVGEIGGVKYKLAGAVKKKADIFICPKGNLKEALRVKDENNYDIKIYGVETFEEALTVLENL